MWKQFADATGRVCRQPLQDIPQVQVGIMSVEPGRVDQTHHCSRPLACT